MVNPQKRKGDTGEWSLKKLFRSFGFPWTERTRAGYERDAGDLHLVPGPLVICQSKMVRTPNWRDWLAQLAQQKCNARADVAFIAWKRVGIAPDKSEAWLAVMPLAEMAELIRRAGYGESVPGHDSVDPPLDQQAS